MPMTRKHFKALAEALRWERPEPSEAHYPLWVRYRDAIADACAQFNLNFDRGRFNAATEE